MSDLRIDYSRDEADRRMRLLEMAGGDLRKAIELERWVLCGSPIVTEAPRDAADGPIKFVPAVDAGRGCDATNDLMPDHRITNTDDLSIPSHLRRTT